MKEKDVASILKSSPKGQLQYNRDPPSNEFLESCAALPTLSHFHKENLKVTSTIHGLDHSINNEEKGAKDKEEHENGQNIHAEKDRDRRVVVLSTGLYNLSSEAKMTISPDYCRSERAIQQYDRCINKQSKVSLARKVKEFKNHDEMLRYQREAKLQEIEKETLLKALKMQEFTKEQYIKGSEEMKVQHEKLKEDHRQHAEHLDLKHKEIQEKIRLVEEEKKKIKELNIKSRNDLKAVYLKLQELGKSAENSKDIMKDVESALKSLKGYIHKIDALFVFEKDTGQMAENLPVMLKEAITWGIQKIESTKKAIAEDEARQEEELAAMLKEKEEKAAKEAKAKAEKDAKEQAAKAFSADLVAVKNYVRLKKLLMDTEVDLKPFSTDGQLKQIRFEFQKSINSSINTISAVSGEHLRDKLQRLHSLLSGQNISSGKNLINLSVHPLAEKLALNTVAKMFVKMGDGQISSKHELAFSFAMVAVGVWSEHPKLGDYLLAHFYKECPFLVPYHPIREEGESREDYFKTMGYRYDQEGIIETQDKFLKRMSGIMRLYAAILVSFPPRGQQPHGIEHAWIWLSRILNMSPLPDITATLIYDMLQVCGHLLYKQYQKQFLKLLSTLCEEYTTKLQSVASSGGGGPVTRLHTFLENCIAKQGKISPPLGLLEQSFWMSR